ncbi:MAG: alpha/beta hydrolase [Bacteroidota bacterium]
MQIFKQLPVLFFLLCLHNRSQAQNTTYRTDTLSVSVYSGHLYGTLFHPTSTQNPPVVLFIAGSGPTDRDGNSTLLPGKNNSLLQLAQALVQNGIASLRYDKRGIGQSNKSLQREESLVFEQNSADARVWLQRLYEIGYRHIYVAGHSEGSLVALQVAQNFPLSGLISLAGAGRPIQDVLREQLASLPSNLKNTANQYLDSLASGNRIAQPSLQLLSLFRPSIQGYMISWMQLDPAKLLAALSIPSLILQGDKDIQVNVADAQRLANASSTAQLHIIPTMNHVFKAVMSDSPQENMAAYSDPSKPVVPALVKHLVDFIR